MGTVWRQVDNFERSVKKLREENVVGQRHCIEGFIRQKKAVRGAAAEHADSTL